MRAGGDGGVLSGGREERGVRPIIRSIFSGEERDEGCLFKLSDGDMECLSGQLYV